MCEKRYYKEKYLLLLVNIIQLHNLVVINNKYYSIFSTINLEYPHSTKRVISAVEYAGI